MHNRVELFLYAFSQHITINDRDRIKKRAIESGVEICWTCFNVGSIEAITCTRSASECCGGCFKNVSCPDCG